MKQQSLALPREMQRVDLVTVQRQPSMTKAIVLCAELGGFENDKDFCRVFDIDPSVWARVKDGERCLHHDKFEQLFDVCANEVPLTWLADRRGYALVPKETEMQRRLRLKEEELAEERLKNSVLMKALQGRAG